MGSGATQARGTVWGSPCHAAQRASQRSKLLSFFLADPRAQGWRPRGSSVLLPARGFPWGKESERLFLKCNNHVAGLASESSSGQRGFRCYRSETCFSLGNFRMRGAKGDSVPCLEERRRGCLRINGLVCSRVNNSMMTLARGSRTSTSTDCMADICLVSRRTTDWRQLRRMAM